MIGLVGETGAGKTTLIDIISGLLAPTEGVISWNGRPYGELDLRRLRRRIGYVTQEPVVMNDTVLNNIILWDPNPDMARVLQATQAAHAMEFIDRMPEGLKTMVGERGQRLSGGQRQRLALARELYRDPELLIVDEGTSALDSETEHLVQASLVALKGRKTVIMIAHRLSTLRQCESIIVLKSWAYDRAGQLGRIVRERGRMVRSGPRPAGRRCCVSWLRAQWLRAKVRLFRLALMLRSPILIAAALALLIDRQRDHGKLSFLAIYKDQFEEDVALIEKTSPEIGLRPLSLYYLKQIFVAAAGQGLAGLTEANYHVTHEWDLAKARYRALLMPTIRHLRRFLGLRGVISCNFNYIAQQELAVVCRDLELPLFIILKEGMIVPERQSDWHRYYPWRYYSGPIIARALFTANAYVARWIKEAPFIGTTAEMIPTGIPRTDAYKTRGVRNLVGRSLVVFAFDPAFSFRYFKELYPGPGDPALVGQLQVRTRKLYESIFEYAARHPDVPVIIKAKPRSQVQHSIEPAINELCKRYAGLQNLTITDRRVAIDLISEAKVVIALNSTTVAEAIMSRRRVLTPNFDDFFAGEAWHYFHAFPDLLALFDTSDDLEAAMAFDARPHEATARAFTERQLALDGDLSASLVAQELVRMVQPPDGARHYFKMTASRQA